MKRINKALSLMLAAALSCVVLAGNAFATSGEAVWADVAETSGEVSASIETNAAVTDGVIDVTFNAGKLTYVDCDFDGGQVAMYAVNDTQAEDGIIKISWIAKEETQTKSGSTALFQLSFTGTDVTAQDITLAGSVYTAQGETVSVGEQPVEPTVAPTTAPTTEPTSAPTGEPTSQPTTAPGGEDTGDTTQPPETGDTANLTLYVGLLAVCVVVLAGVGIYHKKGAAK